MEKPNFVIVTGPESTGKTELAKALAVEMQCLWVPELSRQYIEQLTHHYTKFDVETIARLQIEQFNKAISTPLEFTIFDTGLIITKVWFDVVYRDCPYWLIQAIQKLPKALHLICATDIPWVPDGIRENGGEKRETLLKRYINEIEFFHFPYFIVNGMGDERTTNALKGLAKFYK